MSGVPPDARFTEAWRLHRPYLVDLAFRMLGDIGEAEDVVQEAFTRRLRAGHGDIDDERGWLIVVTSRLCLDHIKSAPSRRQRVLGTPLVDTDTAVGASAPVDPADRVTLDDNVRLALLVVLERLSPAERVVFVLHDVFRVPFDAVADTMGKSVAACRQLASRARRKVEAPEAETSGTVDVSRHRLVTDRFIAACARGDLEGLLEVLDPEVSGTLDVRSDLVVRGAGRVGANLLRFWGPHATLVSQTVVDQPVVLGFIDRRLEGALVLSLTGDRVTKVHAIVDPRKLGFLRSQLAELS